MLISRHCLTSASTTHLQVRTLEAWTWLPAHCKASQLGYRTECTTSRSMRLTAASDSRTIVSSQTCIAVAAGSIPNPSLSQAHSSDSQSRNPHPSSQSALPLALYCTLALTVSMCYLSGYWGWVHNYVSFPFLTSHVMYNSARSSSGCYACQHSPNVTVSL